ncbi:MAG TPA: ribosome biogenesis GTPase Der [Candidatus Caccovivens faecavium]|nr:ribosome biogenesis GTPase Der [Candidatus Caccovivens faecavium]
MSRPIVAIVGRANVGKSTLFNKICGKRISIVDDVAGVTRDRIYADAEWCGQEFSLVDTGGLEDKSEDVFQSEIKEQVDMALDNADVIIFLVDGKVGVTNADMSVASMLRKKKLPVVLVANKLDNFDLSNLYDFYSLGLGDPMPISCSQGRGIGDVLDKVTSYFPKDLQKEELNGIKLALVGRPNVGKSSLINRLLGKKRVVVSDVEGTTRDAVTIPFRCNKKDYYLVDTAGLRRQRSVEKESVEGYSVLRSMLAIDEADVVLIVFDASKEITEQDVRIAGYVHEAGKPSVVVVNKWDLKTMDKNKYGEILKDKLSFMSYFVPIYVSALTGKGLSEIMEKVDYVYENASRRITTGVLNDILQDAILNFEPPSKNGQRAKILYATEASTNPPKFVFFCKEPKLINFSYERYLENRLREKVDFSGTPIELVFKGKEEE